MEKSHKRFDVDERIEDIINSVEKKSKMKNKRYLFRKNLEGWKHPIFYGSFRFIMEGPFHKKLDRKQKKNKN